MRVQKNNAFNVKRYELITTMWQTHKKWKFKEYIKKYVK